MAETVRISVVLFSLHVLLAKWHSASTSIWKFSKTCQMTTTELSIEPINELESTSLDMKLRTFIFPRTWRNSSGWEMIISCLSLAHMRWRRLSILSKPTTEKKKIQWASSFWCLQSQHRNVYVINVDHVNRLIRWALSRFYVQRFWQTVTLLNSYSYIMDRQHHFKSCLSQNPSYRLNHVEHYSKISNELSKCFNLV